MLLGILGASLLGNILTGRGVNRAGKDQGINRAGEGVLRAGFIVVLLKKLTPHPLTNFEI